MCLLSTKYGIEMVQLTPEQRIYVVNTYFQTEKYTEVRRLFQERYPESPPPNKTTIWKNVDATSLNMNKGRSGRKRTVRCQENIDIVQEALENNPRGISCRKNGLNLPSATFNRIVSKDLNWHPWVKSWRL